MSWFKFFHRKKVIVDDEYSEAIKCLHEVDVNRLKSVFSSDNSILTLRLPVKNINELLKTVRLFNKAFNEELTIERIQVPSEVKEIYIRDFYIDSNGLYVDLTKTTLDLFKEIEALLLHYQSLSRKVELSAIETYNQRVTSQFLSLVLAFIKTYHHTFKRIVLIQPRTLHR